MKTAAVAKNRPEISPHKRSESVIEAIVGLSVPEKGGGLGGNQISNPQPRPERKSQLLVKLANRSNPLAGANGEVRGSFDMLAVSLERFQSRLQRAELPLHLDVDFEDPLHRDGFLGLQRVE